MDSSEISSPHDAPTDAAESPWIRAFIALNFSVAGTRKIAEEVERRRALLTGGGGRVAWVPAANYHLTLSFLGQIDVALVDALRVRLESQLARRGPFELRAKRWGVFPAKADGKPPRVLWVGVEAGELAGLQRDVAAVVTGLGVVLPGEARAFHPHVTVGRVRGDAPLVGLEEWLTKDADKELASSRVGELVIYESSAKSVSGIEYAARARVALGAMS